MTAQHSPPFINAFIVEDEPNSRDLLAGLLEEYCPDVKVTGHAASVNEAYMRCGILKPDLVFLDVELAGENAFHLLSRYEKVPFRVIFVTSYHHYAIQAIRFAALDYILKPVVIEDLQQAVRRYRTTPRPSDERLKLPIHPRGQDIIALPVWDGYECVHLREIIYCEASSNYTSYHLIGGRKLVISRTLKESELVLRDAGFLRIHSSFLVNVTHIKRFLKSAGGSVLMSNGEELSISPKRKDELLNAMLRL